MGLKVSCYEGYRAEEEPRELSLGDRVVELTVVERWRTPQHRWFRVRDQDGAVHVLKHDEKSGEWEWG